MKGIECAFDARVIRDAELKTARSGNAFVKFSVVVLMRGDKEQPLTVLAWRDTFCELSPELKAGVEVYIEGALEMSEWDNRPTLSVSASKVEPKGLIGRRKPKAPRKAGKAKVDPQAPIENARPFDDALPF